MGYITPIDILREDPKFTGSSFSVSFHYRIDSLYGSEAWVLRGCTAINRLEIFHQRYARFLTSKMCKVFNRTIYTPPRKRCVDLSTYRRCVQESKIGVNQKLYRETEDTCGKLFNPGEYSNDRNFKFIKHRNKHGKSLLVETGKPEPLTEKIRW